MEEQENKGNLQVSEKKTREEHLATTNGEGVKDLNYWKKNAEEDYKSVPISVLRYITELEKLQPSEQPQQATEEACDCESHTFYEWEKDQNKCSQCGRLILSTPQPPQAIDAEGLETKVRELVTATLVIGVRRGSEDGIHYEGAKEKIEKSINGLTKRFLKLFKNVNLV